jgi:hypothetical protein
LPQRPAIEIALDLRAMPSLVKTVRKRPLPPEVTAVIRVAAGSAELTQAFSTKYGCSDGHIRESCIFFLQQVLLFSGADNFRALGVSPGASVEQIRTHRRWLLMWLHPDRNQNRWESAMFARVQSAAKALDDGVPTVVKPAGRPSRRHRRGRKLAQTVKKPQAPSRSEDSIKRLVLLICVVTAVFLSVATIVSVFGAETSFESPPDISASFGWSR